MEVGEASNAVTQFVRDNIDSNIVYSQKHCLSFNGLDQSHLSGTTFARSTDDSSCSQGEVEGT